MSPPPAPSTGSNARIAFEVEAAREREREAFARLLHDEVGSVLTALAMHVAALVRRLPPDPVLQQDGSRVKEILAAVMQKVRQIQSGLRPDMLDHFGLRSALEWQVEEFAQRTDLPCRFEGPDADPALDRDRGVLLLRLLQAALHHLERHGELVGVLAVMTAVDGTAALNVEARLGDGAADPDEDAFAALAAVAERARYLGGDIAWERSGQRARVRATLPLAALSDGTEAGAAPG